MPWQIGCNYVVMRSKSVKLAIPEAPVRQSTMNKYQGRLYQTGCRIYDRNAVCGSAGLSLYRRIHSSSTAISPVAIGTRGGSRTTETRAMQQGYRDFQ
jgi:hypothetical protein